MADRHHEARRRVALYSHDTVGLGHLRRNLALATSLRRDSDVDVLLISGSREAVSFPVPEGVDFLTLPALAKRDGAYGARTLTMGLDDLVRLRSATIAAALSSFDPHVLIVDKVARGACGELDTALAQLRESGRTSCVLGLRDVLDDRSTTREEWDATGTLEAIADFYDAVWVYGDRTVFDLPDEYGLPSELAERTTFTGYLGHGRPRIPVVLDPSVTATPYALCLVGGGQDGVALTEAFVAERLPGGLRAVVVTGPYMEPAHRRRIAGLVGDRADVTLIGFIADCQQLIDRAAAVVSMGGYNTVCESLVAGKRPLIVPRVVPRVEQLIRARRLFEVGAVDLLHPAALDPGVLSGWLEATGSRSASVPVDLDGIARVPALVERLVDGVRPKRELCHDAA